MLQLVFQNYNLLTKVTIDIEKRFAIQQQRCVVKQQEGLSIEDKQLTESEIFLTKKIDIKTF